MNFGEALEALKAGALVAREGWNGKGMFLALHTPDHADSAPACHGRVDGHTPAQPHIWLKTAQDEWQPGWLASQSDMLSEDWEIIS